MRCARGDQPDARDARRPPRACCTPRSTRCRSARSCAPRSPCASAAARRPRLEIMIPLVAYERELELVTRPRAGGRRGGGLRLRRGLRCRDDDRASPGMLHRRPDRAPRRLLLVRHQRPHPNRHRVLARRRRGADHPPLRGAEGSWTPRRSRRSTNPASASWCGSPCELGRRGKAGIELGVCGEHGGDPASIRFFHACRPGLRQLLALPPADRPRRRRPGADRRAAKCRFVLAGCARDRDRHVCLKAQGREREYCR